MLKLILGSTMIAIAPILVKSVLLGPTTIGFYRCGLAVLILLPFVLRKLPHLKKLPREFYLYVFAAGLLFALDLTAWHRSVIYSGAGIATILANTQVFYLSLIGILILGEKMTWKLALSVPLAFIGVFLLAKPGADYAVGPNYWWGIALGLFTGIVYSGFILTLKKVQKLDKGLLDVPTRLALICLVTAIIMMITAFFEGALRLPSKNEFYFMAALALGPQVLGWIWISTGLPKVNVSKAGLILLIQPVLATILGAAIFNEHLSSMQMLGAAVTLGMIAINR